MSAFTPAHSRRFLLSLALAAGLPLAAGSAQAGGASYGAVGFPGVMAGYAWRLNDAVVLRADYAALRSRSKDGEHEGIAYKGELKARRLGFFADYFPMDNGLRFTGGLTVNHMRVDLRSDFRGGTVNVGGTPVPVSSSDYFNVHVSMPRVTPYVGIGWGQHTRTPGWGFMADIGASIGRAKVAVDTNLQQRGASQADIDRETQELRDGVGRIRAVPQVSVGLSYRY